VGSIMLVLIATDLLTHGNPQNVALWL
jgi:hypothetical protein